MKVSKESIMLKCDACGRFIAYQDILEGIAIHKLLNPKEYGQEEEYATLCKTHYCVEQ